MAKGLEDTAFYVYNRLISLNEVGGEPDLFDGARWYLTPTEKTGGVLYELWINARVWSGRAGSFSLTVPLAVAIVAGTVTLSLTAALFSMTRASNAASAVQSEAADIAQRMRVGVDAITQGKKVSGYTDTGVTLISDDPQKGVDSKDSTFGTANCWG